jgi:hypothetical protein
VKVSEFREIIREEVYKALREGEDRPLGNIANLPFHYPWTDEEKVAWVFELQGAEVAEKGSSNYSLVKLPTKAVLWEVKNRSEYVTTDRYGDQMGKDYKHPVTVGFMGGGAPGVDTDDDEEMSLSLVVVGSPETFQQIVKKYLGSGVKKIPMGFRSMSVETNLSPLVNLILQASKKQPIQYKFGIGGVSYKTGSKKKFFLNWMKQFPK